MSESLEASLAQTERQVAHWVLASSRLSIDDLAAPESWQRLEGYLGFALRRHLRSVLERLQAEAAVLTALARAARSHTALLELERKLLVFRQQFVRTELTLDFFADAINTRTNARTGALLRACDSLAYRSMAQVLEPLGLTTPSTLTYLDEGLGASILKQGLRLWDGGGLNPVAAIKVPRYNMLRPTSLVHEAGHQVAHITGWNDELSRALAQGLAPAGELAAVWAGWASEIAGDALAFVTTGFAAVAALHDVVAGEAAQVFRWSYGDPHPVSYLRVLLNVEMCRRYYGSGIWDDLASSWLERYPARGLPPDVQALVDGSRPLLMQVVDITLERPAVAFGGRSLAALVQPARVSPRALSELSQRVGPALFTSSHWLWNEPLRILALTGLMAAERPRELPEILGLQEQALLRLGGGLSASDRATSSN